MGEGPLPQREPPAPRSIKKEPHLRGGAKGCVGPGKSNSGPTGSRSQASAASDIRRPPVPKWQGYLLPSPALSERGHRSLARWRTGRQGQGSQFRFASSVIARAGRSFPSLLDNRDLPKGFELTSLTPLYGLYDTGHNIPSTRRFIPHGEFLAVGARLLAF